MYLWLKQICHYQHVNVSLFLRLTYQDETTSFGKHPQELGILNVLEINVMILKGTSFPIYSICIICRRTPLYFILLREDNGNVILMRKIQNHQRDSNPSVFDQVFFGP